MSRIIRKNDFSKLGEKLLTGAKTVVANNMPMGIKGSILSKSSLSKEVSSALSKAVLGSKTVFVEGVPVLKTGSITSIGKKIITGSKDIGCG